MGKKKGRKERAKVESISSEIQAPTSAALATYPSHALLLAVQPNQQLSGINDQTKEIWLRLG